MTKFYPNIQKTRIKVGIYSLFTILILILSYLWLTGRMQLSQQQELRLSFDNVMGLEIGDKIMYRGMEIGRVREIFLNEDKINVNAMISKEIKLLEGARFYVGDSSLMGGKNLNILQGKGPGQLMISQRHPGESPAGIMTVMEKATGAVDELSLILAEIRQEGGLLDQSGQLLRRTDDAMANIDGVVVDFKRELSGTLDKVDYLTSSIAQAVNENEPQLRTMISAGPSTFENVNKTLDSLQVLSAQLNSTASSLNTGSGTAARIINDGELYTRMLDSIAKLDSLVADVKENPRKYIKFSLF